MTELIKYDEACRAVAEAARVDEVKDIKDKMEALELYARQVRNPELEADAWAIRKRAEDKLGELTLQIEKAHKVGPGIDVQLPIGGKLKKDVLAKYGISTSAAQRYEQFHLLPSWERTARIKSGQEAIRSGRSIADIITRQKEKADQRAARERELARKILALPTKKYGVILADPEWRFEPWSRSTGMDRAADNHYSTSAIDIIKTRDVASIAADDCAALLWVPQPMLRIGLDTLETWGFNYKSHWVWLKDRIGLGYWNRNKHELLLLGTRGEIPCPAQGEQWDSVLEAPRRGHSEKPEIFLELVEYYWPNIPRIELNRRGPARPGWDAWGFEAEPYKPAFEHAVERRA